MKDKDRKDMAIVCGEELVDEDLVIWSRRAVYLKSLIKKKVTRELITDYLEQLAMGKRTMSFLKARNLTWSDLNEWITLPSIYAITQVATRVGERVRVNLAEDELLRRAIEGVDKPIYYKGQQIDTVKEYSDTLLQMMLKAGKPDKYSEKHKVDHGGLVLNLQINGVR